MAAVVAKAAENVAKRIILYEKRAELDASARFFLQGLNFFGTESCGFADQANLYPHFPHVQGDGFHCFGPSFGQSLGQAFCSSFSQAFATGIGLLCNILILVVRFVSYD